MLTRSIVAVLCGAIAVAGYPDQGEHRERQDYIEPHEVYGQETFNGFPKWIPDAIHGAFGDHPKPPPIPPQPHPPHHSPNDPKVDNKTVYQALKDDSRFSRVFKLVNFTEDVTSILNDSDASVTFFAVPDKALKPPKHHHKHKPYTVGLDFDSPDVDPFYNTVAGELSSSKDEIEMFSILEGFVDYSSLDDDDDKERKRQIIKKIVTAVLKYHILPDILPAKQLATNNTYATGLKLGDASLDSQALRVRISSKPRLLHPQIKVNFYASVLYADVKTENGIVHVINHPLFPPPSIFTVLFAFSDVFSTLTSALQRVNLTDEVDWHWVHSSHSLEGSPAVTFFAPTNKAFHHLPKKLKFYLFSPFGARALKKILAYHVVPDYIFHTNWAHNASDDFAAKTLSHSVDIDPYSHMRVDDLGEEFNLRQHFEEEYEVSSRIATEPSCASDVCRAAKGIVPESNYGRWHEHDFGRSYPEPVQDEDIEPLPRMGGRCSMLSQQLTRQTFLPASPSMHESHLAARELIQNPSQCMGVHRPGCGPRRVEDWCRPLCQWEPKPPRPPHLPHPKPVYALNATLPTLLSNHSLEVHVAQFHSILPHGGYVTTVFVNGQWVIAADVPTRNGAVHVVNRLIRPLHKGHHDDDHDHPGHMDDFWFRNPFPKDVGPENEWDDWEEWLPQWANEE